MFYRLLNPPRCSSNRSRYGCHGMEAISALLALCGGFHSSPMDSLKKRASITKPDEAEEHIVEYRWFETSWRSSDVNIFSADQVWFLLNQLSTFFPVAYPVYVWQVFTQHSCSDPCRIWMVPILHNMLWRIDGTEQVHYSFAKSETSTIRPYVTPRCHSFLAQA